ncbi:MAG: hypothetical protein ACHQ1H_06385, partial [Nitrososphaerales archaeon]
SSFEERTTHLLTCASNAERLNKLALRRIIEEMVQSRIQSGESGKELVDSIRSIVWSYKHPFSRKPTRPLNPESPDTNKKRLTEAYDRVSPTIDRMGADEMFYLIAELKARKLLIEILKPIPLL